MTREERTNNILAKFRDLPGEFYMLKGLLCLPNAVCPPDDTVLNPLGWEARRAEERRIDDLYDGMAIATRMDEINNTLLGVKP